MTYVAHDGTWAAEQCNGICPLLAACRVGQLRTVAVTAELSNGQSFGAYDIVEMAGSGGMGIVYRAEQRALGRTVALKVIRPQIAESSEYRRRFLREAKLASAVDHPHIVSVFDIGEHLNRLYMAMQWVDGPDLRTLIDRHQRLDPDRAVLIGVQLAGALQALQDAGLVHRDVKPSNALARDINGRDHVYLTDFGIAKVPGADDNLTSTGWEAGTSAYMSPEQVRGEQPDSRSDLYALGCIIFEALTGHRPFGGENEQRVRWAHASSPRPLASAMWPALGPRYDAFFARALAVEPEDRFPSGRAFADSLQAVHHGRPDGQTDVRSAEDIPTQVRLTAASASAEPSQSTVNSPTEPALWSAPETTVAPASSTALDPTLLRPAAPQPPATSPQTAERTILAASSAVRRDGTVQAGASADAARGSIAGQMVVLLGGIAFLASVTVLTDYINNGTGWKSLWQATHGDFASPLYPKNFWIPVAFAAAALIFAALSAGTRQRLLIIGAAAAALGMAAYTLYIPSNGLAPGFQNYGPAYWLSLASTVVMLIGAVVALARRRTPT